jgi:hypothetical protein
MRKYNSLDEWAAAQPKPTSEPEPPPEMPIEDPVQAWAREATRREEMRAAAKAELREIEKREIQAQRRHDVALAKANGGGGVDWNTLLNAIADSLDGLTQRVNPIITAIVLGRTWHEALVFCVETIYNPRRWRVSNFGTSLHSSRPLNSIRGHHKARRSHDSRQAARASQA